MRPTATDEHFIRPYTTLNGETIETIWLSSSAKEARAKNESLYWTGKPCLRGHIAPRYASNDACVRCKREHNRTPEHLEAVRRWREQNPGHYAAILGRAKAEKRAPGCTPDGFNIESTIPIYAKARRLSRETGEPWEVDHAIPLSLGGRHEASNLRVITAEENRAKGRIERRLVEAINSDAPLDTYHAVYADVKEDLTELVGTVLRNRIYLAGLRLAKEAEARVSEVKAA